MLRYAPILSAALTVFFVSPSLAEKGPAITDPAKAGPDFALQGEYVGMIETEEGEEEYGAQIIARGDGIFQLVAFVGGLPGDGWTREDPRLEAEGKLIDGKVTALVEGAEVEVSDGIITVTADAQTIGILKKVQRKSPTLGKKPPEGAIVLFDGKSVGRLNNGKLVDGRFLAATNVTSKEKLGDHQLHIEFNTPYMPAARGQGRGNSGVYVQGRYEVQVLDSFGLEGKDNECGGIYSIARPQVNMCFPPLSWQTYDIDFKAANYDTDGNKTENARITVRHNGVVIHDDVELKHGTPGHAAEGPGDEHLFLQDHGNPVVFRNIWVVKK